MALQTIRLKPPHPLRLGEYDLDAVALEHDSETDRFDFRLELGEGLGIYWALPAARHDRLRLAHVDGAAYTMDEPVLIADPWTCDLSLTWGGNLATLHGGEEVISVVLEITTEPPSYRCKVETYLGPRNLDGGDELSWQGAPGPVAGTAGWTAMTWNILMGGAERFEAILEVIARERPDVLVLQECLGWQGGEQLARVAGALGIPATPEHVILGLARPRPSGSRYHVAVVSRFPIMTTTTHADPAAVAHAIVEAVIDAPGGPVRLFGTHFDSHGEQERLRDARSLLAFAANGPVARTLVAGDLNALSRHDPYPADLMARLIAAKMPKYGLPPRFDTMQLLEASGLVDLLWRNAAPARWVTAVREGGGARLEFRTDYLLATPALASMATEMRIVDCGNASDHAPVIARFRS